MTELDNRAPLLPWRVVQGDTWTFPVTKTNTPVSMSGWTFLLQVRRSRGRTAPLLVTFTADTSAAVSGTVTLTPTSTELTAAQALPAGDYWYELQVTKTGSVIQTFCTGPFIIEADTAT